VTITEYAGEDVIEKNDYKSCRNHEGLAFNDLDFKLDLEIDLAAYSAS